MNEYGRDYDDDGRRHDDRVWRERFDAFMRWLKARPVESWAFFIAGVFLGGFFF
ncbi:MAG: hypothetical protein PVI23_08465 [Maricaulaceae bacterium]|jgi:hypothetical protein